MNECGTLTRYNGYGGFVTLDEVLELVPRTCGRSVDCVDAYIYELIDDLAVVRLEALIYESVQGDDM